MVDRLAPGVPRPLPTSEPLAPASRPAEPDTTRAPDSFVGVSKPGAGLQRPTATPPPPASNDTIREASRRITARVLTVRGMGLGGRRMAEVRAALQRDPTLTLRLGTLPHEVPELAASTLVTRLNVLSPEARRSALASLAYLVAAGRVEGDAVLEAGEPIPRGLCEAIEREAQKVYRELGQQGRLPPVSAAPTPRGLFTLDPEIGPLSVGADPSRAKVDAKVDAAVGRFSSQVEEILELDAKGLARAAREGRAPYASDTPLTDDQVDGLQAAASELMLDLPVAALSRNLAEWLSKKAPGAFDDPSLTVREAIGGSQDLAKAYQKKLLREHPVAHDVTVALLVGAAIAVSYETGTKKLEDLGLTPELRTSMLGGMVRARTKLSWERHFANPEVDSEVSIRKRLGDTRVTIGADRTLTGERFSELDTSEETVFFELARGRYTVRGEAETVGGSSRKLDVTRRHDGGDVHVGVDFEGETYEGARLGLAHEIGKHSRLAVDVTVDEEGEATGGEAALHTTFAGGDLGLGVTHDAAADSTAGTITWDRLYQNGVEVAVDLAADEEETKAGLGLRWRF